MIDYYPKVVAACSSATPSAPECIHIHIYVYMRIPENTRDTVVFQIRKLRKLIMEINKKKIQRPQF